MYNTRYVDSSRGMHGKAALLKGAVDGWCSSYAWWSDGWLGLLVDRRGQGMVESEVGGANRQR